MTTPAPTLGNQWSHPTLEQDVDMHAKIDVPLNALQSILDSQRPAAMPRLRVALRTGGATVAQGAVWPFDTVLEDSASAWNSTTKVWTCPTTGLYLLSGQVRSSGNASLVIDWGTLPTFVSGTGKPFIPIYPVPGLLIPSNMLPNMGTNPTCRWGSGAPLYLKAGATYSLVNATGITVTTQGQVSISSVNYEQAWMSIIGISPS